MRYRVAVGLICLVAFTAVLSGCAVPGTRGEVPGRSMSISRASTASVDASYPVTVSVAFLTGGEGGDLESVLSANPNLAARLATHLAPLVREEAQSAFMGEEATARYRVVGAVTKLTAVELLAVELLETWETDSLDSVGGEAGAVRIRLDRQTMAPLEIKRLTVGTTRDLVPEEWAARQLDSLR